MVADDINYVLLRFQAECFKGISGENQGMEKNFTVVDCATCELLPICFQAMYRLKDVPCAKFQLGQEEFPESFEYVGDIAELIGGKYNV